MIDILETLLALSVLVFVVGMCGAVLWLLDYLIDD